MRRNAVSASSFLPGVSWGTRAVDLQNRKQEKPVKNKNSSSRRRISSMDEEGTHEGTHARTRRLSSCRQVLAAEGQSFFFSSGVHASVNSLPHTGAHTSNLN